MLKRADTLDASAAKRETKQPGGKRSKGRGRHNELGAFLGDLRTAKRLSLRQVEEATDRTVSNAYLSQVENGKIRKPSPNVLHSLAVVYAVPYETLMEKAGYLPPSQEGEGRRASKSTGRRKKSTVFAIEDLTAEEERELLKYLAFLRSRNSSSVS